ncbi:hypothetical protein ACR31S_10885 [Streptococcus iniae]
MQGLEPQPSLSESASPTQPLEDILKGIKDDGLHFGEKGYEILARTIYQAL